MSSGRHLAVTQSNSFLHGRFGISHNLSVAVAAAAVAPLVFQLFLLLSVRA